MAAPAVETATQPEPPEAVAPAPVAAPVDPGATPGYVALGAEAPSLIEETRRGPKTTEFWGAIVAAVIDVVTELDSKDKVVVSALAGIYAIARGIAKHGVPNVIPAPPA